MSPDRRNLSRMTPRGIWASMRFALGQGRWREEGSKRNDHQYPIIPSFAEITSPVGPPRAPATHFS